MGAETEGVEILGAETEGVETVGVVTFGVVTDGTVPTGVETVGVVTEGTVTVGVEILGTVTVGVELGTVTVGTETLGTVADGVETLGTDTDDTWALGSVTAPLESDCTASAVKMIAVRRTQIGIDRRVMWAETPKRDETCEMRPIGFGAPRDRACRLGEMVARYRSVLSVPGSIRLLASALLGRLPQGMASLAILLLVRGATHSYAAAGLAVGAYALSNAACAPLQGRLVDRFGRVWVLVPSAIGQAALLVGLTLAADADFGGGALVVLSGLAGALAPPIAPTVRALLRAVFPDPVQLDSAYALDAVLQEVVWITGPLVVAVVIAVASPSVAVVLCGAVYVAGTCLFVRSPLARGSDGRRLAHERTSALASPELRALLGPMLLMGIGLGAIEVGLPALAIHAGSRPASGLLLALWSVGSMAGGLWYGSRAWRASLASRYRVLLVLAVVCTAPLIAARSIPAGVIGALLAGVTIAPVFSCQYALVSRAVSPGSETEAFTWVSAALIGGLAAGSAIAGATIGAAGISAPFAIACLASIVAAGIAARVRDHVPQSA
ncbi:MAG TPA: MFS transporter [Solirubrobacteraceae bacterium]